MTYTDREMLPKDPTCRKAQSQALFIKRRSAICPECGQKNS